MTEKHMYNLKSLKRLIVLANLNQIAIDLDQVLHKFSITEAVSKQDMLRVSKKYGLRAKMHSYPKHKVSDIHTQSLIQLNTEEYIVIAQKREDKFLVFDPDEQGPKLLTVEELQDISTLKVLYTVDRKFMSPNVKFGLKWFIPSIIKFKKAFIEVLIGALTLQLLGLDTPMVTQVIVDKDIGFINMGDKVDIKVDTFPFQKYGVIEGEIIFISPDAYQDEKMGDIYKIKVKPSRETIQVNGKEMRISSGMTVTAEVKVGKRRIIEFFLPASDYIKDSFKLR